MTDVRNPLAPLEGVADIVQGRDVTADRRAHDVLYLLPDGAQLSADPSVPEHVSAAFGAAHCSDANAVLAYRRPAAMSLRSDVHSVVLIHPERSSIVRLQEGGFHHTLLFAAIPSVAQPRLLIPIDNREVTLSSLNLLATYRWTARIKKIGLTALVHSGLARHAGDTVLLARRRPSDLERAIDAIVGLSGLHIALMSGAASEFRKLTIQILRDSGEAIGFAKLGTSAAANEAIQRECDVLRDLARSPELRDSVPVLFGTMQLGESLVMVQSSGLGSIGKPKFGEMHNEFLTRLAQATKRRVAFNRSVMWMSMHSTYCQIAPRLSRKRLERIRAAFGQLEGHIGSTCLTLGMAHRDFGPWNSRIQNTGTLFVFDWETAQHEMVPLYDFFDFHIRSHVLLGKHANAKDLAAELLESSRQWHPGIRADLASLFFLAYLLDRVLNRTRYALWRGEQAADELLSLLEGLLDARASWMNPA